MKTVALLLAVVTTLAAAAIGTWMFVVQPDAPSGALEGAGARMAGAAMGQSALETRRAQLAAYRLKPDVRLMGALELVPRWLGKPALQPTLEFHPEPSLQEPGHYTLEIEGRPTVTIAALPDFTELSGLLAAQAAELEGKPAAAASSASSSAELLEFLAKPHGALEALPARLPALGDGRAWTTLSRALVALSFHQLDLLEVNDELGSYALAACHVAQVASGHELPHELALLARVLGYSDAAAAVVAELESADPVVAFVRDDAASLERERARSGQRGAAAELLYLYRKYEHQDPELAEVRAREMREEGSSLGLLLAALRDTRFDQQRQYAQRAPLYLWAHINQKDQQSVAELLEAGRFYRGGQADHEALEQALRSALSTSVSGALEALNERFSSEAPEAATDLRGHLTWSFWHAALVSSLFREADFHMRRRGDTKASDALAVHWAQYDKGPVALVHGWFDLLRQGSNTRGRNAQLAAQLSTQKLSTGASWAYAYRTLRSNRSDRIHGMRAAARLASSSMDSRPTHRYSATRNIASDLVDPMLIQYWNESLGAHAATLYPDVARWSAQLRQDKQWLKTILAAEHLPVYSRARAADALAELGVKPEPTSVEILSTALSRKRDDWRERAWLIERLKKQGEEKQVVTLASEWLKTHPKGSFFSRLAAIRAVAESLERQGNLPAAYAVAAPAAESYHAETMALVARLAAQLEHKKEALDLARKMIERYPNGDQPLAALAEVHWILGESQQAAQALRPKGREVGNEQWYDFVAPAFARVFSSAPKEAGARAVTALLRAGHAPNRVAGLLEKIVSQAQGREDESARVRQAALWMMEVRSRNPLEDLSIGMTAQLLLENHGEPNTGSKKLEERIHGKPPPIVTAMAYEYADTELMWRLGPGPEAKGESAAFDWLLRAAAHVRNGKRDAGRGNALLNYFNEPGGSYYRTLARYLLGLEEKSAAIVVANNPKRRCEAAYYLGEAALAEHNPHEAVTWFLASVETGADRNAEYHWSRLRLGEISQSDVSMNVLATQLATKEPSKQRRRMGGTGY